MSPLPSKYAFVTFLIAAATIRCSPLPLRQSEPVVERQLLDSIGDLFDQVESGLEDAFGVDTSNVTPTLPVARDVFEELTLGALYSNAAYCSAGSVETLTCGATCEALGDITVAFTGGDNEAVPAFFIAFDPSIQSVVVSTQGTEPTELMSILTDLQLLQDPLNPANFPSAPPTAGVHEGFQKAFELSSQTVLDQVTALMAANNVNKVFITGHSLGAAIATLQAVFLKEQLGDAVDIKVRVYGLPRVGNLDFAQYVETTLGVGNQFLHMHTGGDPVPSVPPASFLDYTHPAGEIFDNLASEDGSNAVFCPGRENQLCSAANDLPDFNVLDHIGPFATVRVGIFDCLA